MSWWGGQNQRLPADEGGSASVPHEMRQGLLLSNARLSSQQPSAGVNWALKEMINSLLIFTMLHSLKWQNRNKIHH